MATTTPPTFRGFRLLPFRKKSIIYRNLKFVLKDLDKVGDMNDYAYHQGYYDALEWVLMLFFKKVKQP